MKITQERLRQLIRESIVTEMSFWGKPPRYRQPGYVKKDDPNELTADEAKLLRNLLGQAIRDAMGADAPLEDIGEFTAGWKDHIRGKNPRQDRQDPGGPRDYYGMGYEAPVDIDALHEPYEDGPNVTSRIKQRFKKGI